MSYPVYQITEADRTRRRRPFFQVTGNIQSGMVHEDKWWPRPEESAGYISKARLGDVVLTDFSRIKAICESVPAPKKQFELNRRLFPREP
ncbi:hypothetical protein N7512_003384, partial [Penicillium capsulatum]